MPFQPFGYRFEVMSLSSPSDVKAAFRSRWKGWFDSKKGARGWIVGPFICLWFSAFDRYGPMLFGRISRADLGTRITGRAGSDLNGLAVLTVLLPVLALILYGSVSAGDHTTSELLIFGGLILLAPLIFWLAHTDRREAEPLVRFLRATATTSAGSHGATSNVAISQALSLNFGGEEREGPVTMEAIDDALLGVGAGDFVILESAPESYIQTAFHDGGYLLEMRDGDDGRHFEGIRRCAAPTAAEAANAIFTFEEVREAFIAYATEAQTPHFLLWKPMHFPL